MSDSNDLPNPFSEERSVVQRLVAEAQGTHRQPPEQAEGTEKEQPEQESQSTRKQPRFPSEDRRVQRKITVDLTPELKQELQDLAASVATDRHFSAVVKGLIVYALDAIKTGQAQLIGEISKETGTVFRVVEVESSES